MIGRVKLSAVLIGVLVDFALAIGLGLAATLVWARGLVAAGMSEAEIARSLPADPRFLLLALAVGLPSLAAGGFVAGRIAGRDQLLHGVLVGAVSLAISLAVGMRGHPAWFTLSSLVLEVPAAALGAMVARRFPSGGPTGAS